MQLDPTAHLANENAKLRRQLQAAQAGPQVPKVEPMEAALLAERMQVHGEDAGREFRTYVAKSASELDNALCALRRNPMKNQAEIVVEGATMARKRADDVAVNFDVQRKSLRKRQDDVASRIDAALQPPRPAWAALAPELRAMLRSLPEQERYDVLNRAQGTDDHLPLLYAVASAPAVLSGLAPGKVIEARNIVIAIRDPDLLTAPAQLAKESTLLDKCEEGFNRTIAELVDFDAADALRQLAGDPQ